MLNVHSAGKVPYQSAPPLPPRTFYDNLKLVLAVSLDIVKVIVLALIDLTKLPVCLWMRNDPKVIKGQNALITGGANGIGKAIALELAKHGCNIVIADVDEMASETTLSQLREYDVKSIAYPTDVSNAKEVEALKGKITQAIGAVDILVNNAGLMPLLSLREGSSNDIERVIDVNINGNIWTLRTFLNDMIQNKQGHVVQISSLSGLYPLPRAVVYTATKYAVTGLMLALEEELRQDGHLKYINFTTVHPYFVSTRMDMMSSVNLRFPPLSVQQTAKETVKAIIYRKRRIVFPHYIYIFCKIGQIIPYSVQCLARDIIFRESESRVIKDPRLYEDIELK